MMPYRAMINQMAADMEAQAFDTRMLRDHLGHAAFEFFWNLPLPAWIKGVRPCDEDPECLCTAMLAINPAYSAVIGVSLRAYLGQPDNAPWRSDDFSHLDARAYREGRAVQGYEHGKVNDGRDLGGRVYKWPVRQDGVIMAIAGVAIDWRAHSPLWRQFCEMQMRLAPVPDVGRPWEEELSEMAA